MLLIISQRNEFVAFIDDWKEIKYKRAQNKYYMRSQKLLLYGVYS